MKDVTTYTVEKGKVISDCMEETEVLIAQNLEYINQALSPIRNELAKPGDFSFICYESAWTLAATVELVEQSKVTKAHGVVNVGDACVYDELLDSMGE